MSSRADEAFMKTRIIKGTVAVCGWISVAAVIGLVAALLKPLAVS
jgi:hypothetical protein